MSYNTLTSIKENKIKFYIMTNITKTKVYRKLSVKLYNKVFIYTNSLNSQFLTIL